jgi:hypothetical protein
MMGTRRLMTLVKRIPKSRYAEWFDRSAMYIQKAGYKIVRDRFGGGR